MTLVVLIGPPGAGKSTVGHLLAQRLDTSFADTDTLVEQAAGCTISDLFVEQGEPAFRALEETTVAAALEATEGVLALGGGAPMTATTADRLRALGSRGRIVFLDVGIAGAAKRVGFDQSRPLLAVNPRSTWVRLMGVRRPTYEGLADHRVDTSGREPAAVVDEIVAVLVGEGP